MFWNYVRGFFFWSSADRDSWNAYSDFRSAIESAFAKLENRDSYGNLPFRTIIKFRSARILNSSLTIEIDREQFPKEAEWLAQFEAANKLRGSMLPLMAMLGEVQGQVFMPLRVEVLAENKKQVRFNVVRLFNRDGGDFNYKISSDKASAKYKDAVIPDSDYEFVVLTETEYLNLDQYIETPSLACSILTNVEAIDRANNQIRRVNDLYARPTLVVSFKDEGITARFRAWLRGKNADQGEVDSETEGGKRWKLGQTLVLPDEGKAQFIQAGSEGVKSLRDEKHGLAKEISGATGVPLHKLGFPEDMGGGRATAEVSEDMAMFSFEISRWEEAILSLLRKAMRMHNAASSTSLDPSAIRTVTIPITSPELLRSRMTLMQKDRELRNISLQTYLENHPDVDDAEKEINRLAEESAGEISRIMASMPTAEGAEL